MALFRMREGREVGVHSRHLIGRSRRMHTRFDVHAVSAEHAVVAWTRTGWVVRDLASRNGTRVDGQPVDPGVEVPLRQGNRVVFGDDACVLELVDDGPPLVFATSGGARVDGDHDGLVLGGSSTQVHIHWDGEGWGIVGTAPRTPVYDGQILDVGGQAWRLALPEPQTRTTGLVEPGLRIADVGLELRFSADEEYVELAVRLPDRTVPLPPRAHHYPLLVLAREVIADRERGLKPSECGWLQRESLARMLRLDPARINLLVHRARREFLDLGVQDAHELVARRTTTGQLRLGIVDLTLKPL